MMEKITRRPPTPWGNEIIRALATNTQNKITGTRIRDNVRKIDLMSGPNTTLPPQKNFCKGFKTVSLPRLHHPRKGLLRYTVLFKSTEYSAITYLSIVLVL